MKFLSSILSGIAIFSLHSTTLAAATRPATLAEGPNSLSNVINVSRLLSEHQRDAVVMFSCSVFLAGGATNAVTYRATPGAAALEAEIKRGLAKAKFFPAIINGKPTPVRVNGTVIFAANAGHASVHAYLNQEPDELARGSDFIAPQVPWTSNLEVKVLQEIESLRKHPMQAAVELRVTVDAQGKVEKGQVLSEDPPASGAGPAVLKAYEEAAFVPGFRHGRPVSCTFTATEFFSLGGSRIPESIRALRSSR